MSLSPAQVARRWFEEVWAKRHSDTIYELLPEDAVGHMAHAEIVGPRDFHEAWKNFLALMPNIEIVPEQIVEDGEHAVVRWSLRGKHTGDGFGLKASGVQVGLRGMTWMHCRDGRIVEAWDCWNQGELFSKLQASLSLPQPAVSAEPAS